MHYWPCLILAAIGPSLAAEFDASQPMAAQISVQQSAFDAHTSYSGPEMRAEPPARANPNDIYLASLIVLRNGDKARWNVLMQALYYGEWRHYDSASLLGGAQIDGGVVRRSVLDCHFGLCRLAEIVNFSLTPEQAAQAQARGQRLRFNGRQGGSFEAELPAAYFTAMRQSWPR